MSRSENYNGGIRIYGALASAGSTPPVKQFCGERFFDTEEGVPYWWDCERDLWVSWREELVFARSLGSIVPTALQLLGVLTSAVGSVGYPLVGRYRVSDISVTSNGTYSGDIEIRASDTGADSGSVMGSISYSLNPASSIVGSVTNLSPASFSAGLAGQLVTAHLTSGTIGPYVVRVGVQRVHA